MSTRLVLAAAVAMLIATTPPSAFCTTFGSAELVCPLCHTTIRVMVPMSCSTVGGDEEGRPICIGADIIGSSCHACPKCHYAGGSERFLKGEDVPTGAKLDAIRKALAENAAAYPCAQLLPLEEVSAAETCMRAGSAPLSELYGLMMTGAWMADDDGEDELAWSYRKKAHWFKLKMLPVLSEPVKGSYRQMHRLIQQGQYNQALGLCRPLQVQMAQAVSQAQAKADNLVKTILLRKKLPSRKSGDSDVEEDESREDRNQAWEHATDDERELLTMPSRLKNLLSEIKGLAIRCEFGMLDEKGALLLAEKNDYHYKHMFIRLFAWSDSPQVRKVLWKYVVDIDRPDTRPATTTQSQEEYNDRVRRALWVILRNANREFSRAPDVARPVADLIESLRLCRLHKGDAGSHIQWLAASKAREAAGPLVSDFSEHPGDYRQFLSAGFQYVWKTMALNEPAAVANASRVIEAAKKGVLAVPEEVLCLQPLQFVRSKEARDLIALAAASPKAELRLEGARCMLGLNDASSVGTLLAAVDELPKPFESVAVEIGPALMKHVQAQHEPALARLKRHWPGEIGRSDQHDKAYSTILLLAALAKVDPAKHQKAYETAIAQFLEWGAGDEGRSQISKMQLLRHCAELHCVPGIIKANQQLLTEGLLDGDDDAFAVVLLSGAGDFADPIGKCFNRPLPLYTKLELLRTNGLAAIPQAKAAFERWSKSKNGALATAAKAALKQ
ncbi:MAG: hypothetical protein LLG01_03460 [Planctomycetaceae bacterium]|nr:hypothetical protein [Planctomycetaceae bacterium]